MKILVLILSLLITVNIFANSHWEKKEYIKNGSILPYQIYTPDNREEKLPLVIYLHGSGEAGTDNEKQMYTGTNVGPQYFASKEIQDIQQTYVVAPQTPMEMRWASTSIAEYDFQTTPITPSMDALLDLIEKLKDELPIDENRVYIAGLSRGGQGVWNAALHRPDLFAAIVPIAGSASPKDAKIIKDIPTWVFHGDSDTITPIKVSENMVVSLAKLGNTPKFTVIKGGDHASAWLEAHRTTDLWKWMLSNKK